MKIIEKTSAYQKLYEVCLSQIESLLNLEMKIYDEFLNTTGISVVCLEGVTHYFSPQKELTKEEFDTEYQKYRDEKEILQLQ